MQLVLDGRVVKVKSDMDSADADSADADSADDEAELADVDSAHADSADDVSCGVVLTEE